MRKNWISSFLVSSPFKAFRLVVTEHGKSVSYGIVSKEKRKKVEQGREMSEDWEVCARESRWMEEEEEDVERRGERVRREDERKGRGIRKRGGRAGREREERQKEASASSRPMSTSVASSRVMIGALREISETSFFRFFFTMLSLAPLNRGRGGGQ